MNFGLREHLVTIGRHWGKIGLILLGAILVSGAIGFLSSKVYVAETRVLILTQSPAARAITTTFNDGGQTGSPQDQVLTQVAILKSPLLAVQLAEDLGPERVQRMMTWRWDWLRALPTKWKNDAIRALSEWPPTRDFVLGSGITIPDGKPAVVTVGSAAGKIADNLFVDAIVKTDMFGAAFSSPDPAFAAEALNRLITLYSEHVVALNSPTRTAAIAKSEADRLEAALRQAEVLLRDYSDKHGILSLERQRDQLIDRLSRMNDELGNAQREILEAGSKITSLQARISQIPSEEAVSVTTVPNPLADRLAERLAQLETELRQFVPGSPSANKIRIEIEGIRQQLAQISTDVRGSETVGASALYQQLQGTLAQEQSDFKSQQVRADFISAQRADVEAELRRLDGLELTYRELKRSVDAKEEALRYALQKREETAIAEQLSSGSSLAQVVQVEPAMEPGAPRAPRRARLLILGVVVGTMTGIALAYVLEFMRTTVATRREAEVAFGRFVLGVQYRTGLLRHRRRVNQIEMRNFVSRLLHDMVRGKARVLMFAGTEANKSQTGFVTRVADALHEQGLNVLLIRPAPDNPVSSGMDLRILGHDGKPVRPPGEYLAGDARAIRRDTATITGHAAGQREAVAGLLKERRRMYDAILIDSPDIDRFPEALTMTGIADALMPVVVADRSQTFAVQALIDQVAGAGTSLPGMVLIEQRRRRASWAFCWMAMMRRKTSVESGVRPELA